MELYTIGSFPCIQLCQALGNSTAIPDPDERLSAYSETRHQSIDPLDLPLLAISAIVRPMERCDAAAWWSTGQPYFFSHIVEPLIILFPPSQINIFSMEKLDKLGWISTNYVSEHRANRMIMPQLIRLLASIL